MLDAVGGERQGQFRHVADVGFEDRIGAPEGSEVLASAAG
jgi:hypothetical protein